MEDTRHAQRQPGSCKMKVGYEKGCILLISSSNGKPRYRSGMQVQKTLGKRDLSSCKCKLLLLQKHHPKLCGIAPGEDFSLLVLDY